MTWRIGRKNGRVIYEQRGAEPSDDDKPIGMMDTAALAARVVEAVNALGVADEPGRYERRRPTALRCECPPPHLHPYKVHGAHYCPECDRPTGVADVATSHGPERLHVTWDGRGLFKLDIEPAPAEDEAADGERDYVNAPPILCPDCEHSQNMHLQSKWIGCTKVEYLSSGDWASDCPCMLTYDQITARVEMVARLAAHGLAEDEPMPASCLLGRCGHDKAEPVTDMSTWFTKDELAGIADDGVNRMERGPVRKAQGLCACIGRKGCYCDPEYVQPAERLIGTGKPDGAPKIADVAARPQHWSAHEEAGLEPKEWYPGEPPATEDVEPKTWFSLSSGPGSTQITVMKGDRAAPEADWRDAAWAHMPAIAEEMGLSEHEKLKAAYDEILARGESAWTEEQRRLMNKAWLDLLVKGETFIKVQDVELAVGDPAVPEDVVVVELAQGGIVKSGPYIAGEKVRLLGDWAPGVKLDGMFSVPDGIRQALGEGSGNVQVTITGPEGQPLGELINQALLDAVKRENPLTGRREPEVQIIDTPAPTSEMSEELRALVIDWATRARDETGRWPITTGWIKDAVEQVLPEVQEYFEAELRDAGIDPEGMEIEYDFAPAERRYTRPGRPVVDVELPDEPEYRDPDCYVDDNGWCICRRCGTQAMSFKDGGWACSCDSAMHEHMRPEVDDDDD